MDPDIFAIIYAAGKYSPAVKVFQQDHHRHIFRPAPRPQQSGYISGASTPERPRQDDQQEDNRDHRDRLELRLNSHEPLKNPAEGWQFGSRQTTSDVLLCQPQTPCVSRRHFTISITPQYRIQLHQQTKQPTVIHYCYQPPGKKDIHEHQVIPQQGDRVILQMEPWSPQHWHHVRIGVSENDCLVQFEFCFPNHGIEAPKEYVGHMNDFLQSMLCSAPPLGGLGLSSIASTVVSSRQPFSPQPEFGDLLYIRRLGAGGFGVVDLIVDLGNGRVAARKRFLRKKRLIGQAEADETKEWEMALESIWNEVRLMKENPHPNIMGVITFQESPIPSLLMPYYPLGNMGSLAGLQPDQYVSAFRQLLSVLDYLHGRNVAHRDLKPENILVASISPSFRIVVADFGLSKQATPDDPFKTFVGTKVYAAPDMLNGHRSNTRSKQHYWVSVDIWSAGVIMLGWIYGYPSIGGMKQPVSRDVWVKFWAKALLGAVQKHDRDGGGRDPVIGVLKHMIVREPGSRYSARQCLDLGCDNGLFKRARSGEVIDVDDDEYMYDDGAKTPVACRPAGSAAAALAEQTTAGSSWVKTPDESSYWQKFHDVDDAPVTNVDSSGDSESQEYVSAMETLSPEQPEQAAANLPGPAPAPSPATAVVEPPPLVATTATTTTRGQKRLRGSVQPSSPSSSELSSAPRQMNPPKRLRPFRIGYNDAVWADVLGSEPRLGPASDLQTSTAAIFSTSSVSFIGCGPNATESQKALNISPSISMVDDASNISTLMH